MTNLTTGMCAGILGGIAAAMLIFIWWWFPRTWIKGNAQDIAQLDDGNGQLQRETVVQNARDIVEKYRETLKQRELAKGATAQSRPGDLEAQHATQAARLGIKSHGMHTDATPATEDWTHPAREA